MCLSISTLGELITHGQPFEHFCIWIMGGKLLQSFDHRALAVQIAGSTQRMLCSVHMQLCEPSLVNLKV